jgi:hypothetical protein
LGDGAAVGALIGGTSDSTYSALGVQRNVIKEFRLVFKCLRAVGVYPTSAASLNSQGYHMDAIFLVFFIRTVFVVAFLAVTIFRL